MECVLDHCAVGIGTEQDLNRRLVLVLEPHEVVDGVDVKRELACELRLESPDLQLEHDVAQVDEVEEQQVDEVVLAADLEVMLSANEGQVGAELLKRLLQSADQGVLELAFRGRVGQAEELECVRVLR